MEKSWCGRKTYDRRAKHIDITEEGTHARTAHAFLFYGRRNSADPTGGPYKPVYSEGGEFRMAARAGEEAGNEQFIFK
jgi:hypothetical protein